MKKILSTLCICLLLTCLCMSALAAGPAVIDQADLFTASEEARLTELVEQFRQQTHMDFGVITTSDSHAGSSQEQIADALYERGGYGLGEDNSGILYYIDMYERIPYLCTTGAMINYMTDERIEAAHEVSYGYLAGGDYAGAAEAMIASVEGYVRKGIPEGQYQYDAVTGERLTDYHKALTSGEMLVCAIIAAVAALIYTSSVNHGYSLKGSTYSYHFRENSSVRLTEQTDDYLRTTTTRTRKATPPPTNNRMGGGSGHVGGSRTHVSGGGIRHGGGAGRKF